jgi:general secretion pathway protein B
VQPPTVAAAQPDAAPAKPAEPIPAAPAAPAVPQYYELAYAVRKDIPQFNLSMHVFAADPPARFIVVDGERKAEGDVVKEGLVLREVRTDGIVLEFRGQRFFYPRPGH